MNLVRDQIVGQRYQLVQLLGEGGMGAVWSAIHVLTRKPVAIKFLKAPSSGTPDLKEQVAARFLREARAASAVHHPNVVEIHDILTLDDGSPMMVMDLLRGRSLSAHLEQRKVLGTQEMAGILAPIVSALGAAHSLGIVHRDLKPDNLFLAELGDGRIEPKVLDFGIAKLSATDGDAKSTSNLTATGSMLGTPYYMAPEQIFGEKDIDARADIWAFGVIMYECLGGRRPFDGENFGQLLKAVSTRSLIPLEALAPGTPRDLVDLVDRMIRVDRSQRPSDLREIYMLLISKANPGERISSSSFAAPVTPSLHGTAMLNDGRVATGPQLQGTAPHTDPRLQTGPRSMQNSVGPLVPRAMPSTLSGASTSHAMAAAGIPVRRGLPAGAIAAIVAAPVLLAAAILGFVYLSPGHKTRDPKSAGLVSAPSASATAAATPPLPEPTEPKVALAPAPSNSVAPNADAGHPALATTPVVSNPAGVLPGGPTRPTATAPSSAGTTVPGGVVTAAPF